MSLTDAPEWKDGKDLSELFAEGTIVRFVDGRWLFEVDHVDETWDNLSVADTRPDREGITEIEYRFVNIHDSYVVFEAVVYHNHDGPDSDHFDCRSIAASEWGELVDVPPEARNLVESFTDAPVVGPSLASSV